MSYMYFISAMSWQLIQVVSCLRLKTAPANPCDPDIRIKQVKKMNWWMNDWINIWLNRRVTCIWYGHFTINSDVWITTTGVVVVGLPALPLTMARGSSCPSLSGKRMEVGRTMPPNLWNRANKLLIWLNVSVQTFFSSTSSFVAFEFGLFWTQMLSVWH